MAEKTPAKWLHEALVTILADGAESLQVDARSVAVLGHLPDHTFTQRSMPLVVVERPEMEESGPWGGDYERRVYAVNLFLVDATGVRPGDEQEAAERLGMLAEKVKALLGQDENAHLLLPWLHVFWSLCEWGDESTAEGGNNLMFLGLRLSVPMVVDRGAGLEGPATP